MLLTVDIGNSHITLGLFEAAGSGFAETPAFTARMVTERRRTDDQYACEMMQLLTLHRAGAQDVSDAILSSVVPELTDIFRSAIEKLTGVSPLVLGPGVKTGLHVLLDDPAQLGSDLVAGAVAAAKLYPLPCVIFDLGTATTISVLDKNGKFRGGVICAGIDITLDSLARRTSLLPHVNISRPETIIGRNTIHSMQSGAIYGTAAMMDGMIDRIAEELGEDVSSVATGELAGVVASACRRTVHVREYLLLSGLRMIYERNRKS